MAEVCTRRVPETLGRSSYRWNRHQPSSGYAPRNVCKFWLSGNCTRNPCRFLHPEKLAPVNLSRKEKVAPVNSVRPSNSLKMKQSHDSLKPPCITGKRPNNDENVRTVRQKTSPETADENKPSVKCIDCDTPSPVVKQSDVVSSEKPSVECNEGKTQKPSSRDGFSKLAQLEGHQKAVTGINLPSNSDKLYTTSEDGTVRVWNCHTGECIAVVDVGTPVWCLEVIDESDGSWLFAGLTNAVKVWRSKTQLELTLDASGGQVRSLVAHEGILFAGLEDGSVFRWKLNSDASSFESPTLLRGHKGAVVSLCWGFKYLYSGSLDKTVKVWDRTSLQCIHTLQSHSEEIKSLLCWHFYLLSSSLDKTLKVWVMNEMGELDVTYIHNEDHGIVSLNGMQDAAGKPILLCSCSDNSIRLYELPSFKERGRICVEDEVRTTYIGPKGLLFTGNRTGVVSVWRCSQEF